MGRYEHSGFYTFFIKSKPAFPSLPSNTGPHGLLPFFDFFRYNSLEQNKIFSFGAIDMKKKGTRCAAFFCCALLAAGLLGGCGAQEPPAQTAAFAMDSAVCIAANGETAACPAPYVSQGVGYLHLPSALEALGLSVAENVVTLCGVSYPLPAAGSDGYLPVSELLDALPLGCAKRGGLFVLSTGDFSGGAEEALLAARSVLGDGVFADRAPREAPHLCVDPYQRYSYEQMREDVDELCALYPEIAAQSVFGVSAEGRELVALSLGRGDRIILCTASLHACEFFGTNFVMYMADQYAYGWATNGVIDGYDCRSLLDRVRFLIVPMVNPDGVNIAQNGPDAAANPALVRGMDMQGATFYSWKANANGVDLNRNFPLDWRQENYIDHPAARYFCGYEAATEPEVLAMMQLFEDTPFCMALDFHTYGEKIYWIDTNTQDHAERYGEIARRLCETTGYYDFGMEDVSRFGGYLCNYARATYDVFCAVVELCYAPRFSEALFDLCAAGVYQVGLAMADEAVKFGGEPQGLSCSLNGGLLALPGDNRARPGTLTPDQLCGLLTACGFTVTPGAQALTVAGTNGAPVEFTPDAPLEGTLPAPVSADAAYDATAILSSLGIGFSYDESASSLSLFYWT